MTHIETIPEPVKRRRPWRPEEIAKLLEMLTDGRSTEAIAAELGRTPYSVRAKHNHLGIYRTSSHNQFAPIAPLALIVSRHYNVSIHAMRQPSRRADVCRPRQIVMWLAVRAGRSYPRAGRFFHRDHTTAIHAERVIEALRQSDPALRELTDAFLATARENAPEPPPAAVSKTECIPTPEPEKPVRIAPDAIETPFYEDRRRGREFLDNMNARFADAMRAGGYKPPINQDEKLRELHAEGYSATQAARRLGWTKNQVAGRWWKLGLRRKSPCVTREKTKAAKAERERIGGWRACEESRWHNRLEAPPRHALPSLEALFVNPEDKRAGR